MQKLEDQSITMSISLSWQVRAIPGDIGFSVEELEDLYVVFKVTALSTAASMPALVPECTLSAPSAQLLLPEEIENSLGCTNLMWQDLILGF